MTPPALTDVQSQPAEVALAIDRVGVRHLRLPMTVRDRARGRQQTVASVDLFVNLPAHFKGTHMSRFVEALQNWSEDLEYKTLKNLLADIRTRLAARSAQVVFRFPYFLQRTSPASGAQSLMSYQCEVAGELTGELTDDPSQDGAAERMRLTLGVDVPVMTVCPCSLAISDQGAHSQRAMVRIRARATGFVWLEDLIEIAESAGSSPVYALLKREDEKHVTEAAFANPAFVEDVVRRAAARLAHHPQIRWSSVEAESLESIHDHSAFAAITWPADGPA